MNVQTPLTGQQLGQRYLLRAPIGSGGMGTVFTAYDRLTRTTVAVKRISTENRHSPLHSMGDRQMRLTLMHEFKTLARLRHPNIIPVLDYGFDTDAVPYLVMPYLVSAKDFVRALSRTSVDTRVRYLVQLLQALEYLHRHGIIHHDLKPANILIENGRVVVLDFGLAQGMEQEAAKIGGTLLYLAPEILLGEQATVQSDLYAVGVTAYQLLTGIPPYNVNDLHQIASGNHRPYTPLPTAAAHLAPFIDTLLQPQPADRPSSATACVTMLERLTGQAFNSESPAIRESFLQSAHFAGRDIELKKLLDALEATFLNVGTAWLIGGESGVGKSRLLDELRTHALVRGARVLHGEALSTGDLPYQLWRQVIPHLLLYTSPTASDADILRTIVPDLAQILGSDEAGTGDLPAITDQNRLAFAIIDLLRRQPGPTLLLLDDLQWAGESLAILRQILAIHDQLPHLMIVGTYRDDELPSLPTDLPGIQVIRLPRLDVDAVRQVAASMLGDAGRRSPVVDFLWRQTEGNAFFIVEVVRALAEEAGALADIGQMMLPQSVFTGSLKQLMQRRLERVPPDHRPLLEYAAVAGRALDTRLLAPLAGPRDVDSFLVMGLNAGVLEVADGGWRFTHEKLREHLVQQLKPDRARFVNRQIAVALETLHPNNRAYDGVLTDHWLDAGDPRRALPYALRAVKQDVDLSNFAMALNRACRLLADLPEDNLERTDLMILRAEAHQHLGSFEQAQQDFAMAAEMAADRGQTELRANALRGLGVAHWYQGQYTQARTHLGESLALHRQIGHSRGIASCLNNLGIVAISDDDLETAQSLLKESLHLYREIGVDRGIASVLNNLGLISDARKDYIQSRSYYEETLEVFQRLEDRWGIALAHHNLGSAILDSGDYTTAQTYLEQSIDIKTTIGDRHGLALSQLSLAHLYAMTNAPDRAEPLLKAGLTLGQRLGAVPVQVAALAGYGVLFALRQRYASALVVARFLKTQVVGADTAAYSASELLMKRLRQHYGKDTLSHQLQSAPALSLDDLLATWLPAALAAASR